MIELIDEAGYPIYLTSFNDERASDLASYRSFSTVTVVPHFAEAIKKWHYLNMISLLLQVRFILFLL